MWTRAKSSAGFTITSPENSRRVARMFPFELSFVHVVVIIAAITLLSLRVENRRERAEIFKNKLFSSTPSPEDSVQCPVSFGYLKKLPPGGSIPEECCSCPRTAQCRSPGA